MTFLKGSTKNLDTSNIHPINWLKKFDKWTSMKLLKLKFESDNITTSKATKNIVKKYCPIMNPLWIKSSDFTLYKSTGNLLCPL